MDGRFILTHARDGHLKLGPTKLLHKVVDLESWYISPWAVASNNFYGIKLIIQLAPYASAFAMAVMDSSSTDPEMLRIWNLLVEVAEQLNQNRAISISLHTVSGNVKVSPPWSLYK